MTNSYTTNFSLLLHYVQHFYNPILCNICTDTVKLCPKCIVFIYSVVCTVKIKEACCN